MPDPLSELQRLGQEFDADVVEAVAESLALHALPDRYSWAGLHESARELWREDTRAAIEAARPMIEKEAFEKAAKVADEKAKYTLTDTARHAAFATRALGEN